MAFSAFGDEIPDAPTPPGPAAPQPQKAPAQPQVSAFGDPLSAFGDPIDNDVPPAPAQQSGYLDRVERVIDNSMLGDYGRSLARGGVAVGDAAAGIAGLLSGGAIPEAIGYDSRGVRNYIDQHDTPDRQASRQALDQAKGIGGTLQALANNPGNIPHLITESVPSMLAGGGIGRGVALGAKALGAAPAVAGVVGAGTGEGVVAAGQQAEQTRQATGTLTPGQSGLALLSGIGTGLLGAAGARIGRRLGVADIDAQMAGAGGVDVAKGLVNRSLIGTGIESLEELSQSGQQQVLTNLATDRPALEGVDKSMLLGGVVGGAMGGAASLRRPTLNNQVEQPPVPPAAAPQAEGMATPAPLPATPPAQPQPAPQPVSHPVLKTPFAGSSNVRPLFESMGMDQQHMDSSLALLADDAPDIEAARRGTISWEETGRLAALTGTTVEKLRKHRLGVAFNAEEQIAATRLLKDQTLKTLDLGSKISSGTATEIEQANFLQSLHDLRTTQKAVLASRAEIGRAMSAMRADVTTMKQAGNMLESVGGAQGAKAIADALTNAARIGGVEAANQLARQAGSDGFWTFYKSMLLSSPDTHAVNMASNLFTSLLAVPTRTLAGGIGASKRLLSGGKAGETQLAEPIYQVAGLLAGAVNGAKGAATSWRTGEDSFGGNKAEVYRTDLPGQKVWGMPLRALQAEDMFFKFMNDGAERFSVAYRMASQELKGQGPVAINKRVQELLANPPQELIDAGEAAANFHTFTNAAGRITQAVDNLRRSLPYGTGSLVIPFLKTPANLITYAVKHSPAAPVFREVREDIRAGGARQEEALARIGIGSLMVSFGAIGQMGGWLNGGGPEDPEKRRAWLAAGNQPYTIRINGNWVDYSRLEPLATLVGLSADVASGLQDQGVGMASMMKAIGRNFTSKTWLQGLAGVMQAMSDPDRYGSSWVNRSAATLVQPATLLSHLGRYSDPFQREAGRDNFVDQLQMRLPGQFGRESLPIKRDQFGEPVMEPQRQIGRAGPFPISKPSDDPVRQEASRLGWAPQPMKRGFTLKPTVPGQRSEKVELTMEQQNELNELANSRMHAEAKALVQSPLWKTLDDDERVEALDKIMSGARSSAKKAFTPYLRNGARGAIDLYRNQTAAKARGRK